VVTAVRVLDSSTMALPSAKAASRAWTARLLIILGWLRLVSWMRVITSSEKSGSLRPASLNLETIMSCGVRSS
jgi:hypothetical protein